MDDRSSHGLILTFRKASPRRISHLITFFSLFVALTTSCGSGRLQELKLPRLQLGTTVTITVLHTDEASARIAVEAAFDEMERIEQIMSVYDKESLISHLNRTGKLEGRDADPEILYILQKAHDFSRLSEGAFDITVKPLLDLYQGAFSERGEPPGPDEIERALQRVGFKRVAVMGGTITLQEGTQITLGGIAKGYAIDRAVSILQERGIEHGLVDVGGDMRSFGSKNGEPWNIALQNPRDRNDYAAFIPLREGAVATSGDYERYFDREREYHHIVDPRTGYSATGLISVTIVAATALEADALATAVFVLGATGGMELVRSLEGVEALLITEEGQILASRGLDYSMP